LRALRLSSMLAFGAFPSRAFGSESRFIQAMSAHLSGLQYRLRPTILLIAALAGEHVSDFCCGHQLGWIVFGRLPFGTGLS
jgi:hypothetical protein